jgi:CBS-domain-containing membrane protein
MTDDTDGDSATPSLYVGDDNIPELEVSDEDILESMAEIPGYLDVSTEDFRLLYHLAHRHALTRVFSNMSAGRLMHTGFQPLQPDMRLDEAAVLMSHQGVKALPVVNPDRRVAGILTETDFLRWLQADTLTALMLRACDAPDSFALRGKETAVRTIMTTEVVTLGHDEKFMEIVSAFHAHEGGAMPVVDDAGCLIGMLTRKDFLKACHLEGLL